MPIGGLAYGTRGELQWTLVKRGHQRDKTTRWCRREHATTGADQTPGLRPVTLSRRAARCWPSAGLCGDQQRCHRKFPGLRAVVCHCGGTGDRSLFAPQSSCPRSSWRQGSHLPYNSTGLLRQQRHITIRTVPGWHTLGVPAATEVAVRGRFSNWGPPCRDDTISNSAVTRASVGGRAVT